MFLGSLILSALAIFCLGVWACIFKIVAYALGVSMIAVLAHFAGGWLLVVTVIILKYVTLDIWLEEQQFYIYWLAENARFRQN